MSKPREAQKTMIDDMLRQELVNIAHSLDRMSSLPGHSASRPAF